MEQRAILDTKKPAEVEILLTQAACTFINTMPFREQILSFIGVTDAKTLHQKHNYWFFKHFRNYDLPEEEQNTLLVINLATKKENKNQDFLVIHVQSQWLPPEEKNLLTEQLVITIQVSFYANIDEITDENVTERIQREVVHLIEQNFPSIPVSYFTMEYTPYWDEEQELEGIDFCLHDFTSKKQRLFQQMVNAITK